MASTTTNLGLNKPARTDFVSVVTDINDNMDTLDQVIGAVPSGKNIQGSKADKVASATNGNFAGLDSNGNLTDSGKKASDFALASEVGNVPSGQTVEGQISDLKSAITVIDGKKANSENLYLYKDASGEIVTVDDAVAEAVKSMRIEIAPVQDLHGYDNPWVGGAGKNLIPLTVSALKALNTDETWNGNSYTRKGITYTILTDSDGNVTGINVNGTASSSGGFQLMLDDSLYEGDYILNGCPAGGSTVNSYFIGIQGGSGDQGAGCSIHLTGRANIYIYIYSGTAMSNKVFKPMFRLSSVSDSTFAPYTNICPISGFTGANVSRTGKNLFVGNYFEYCPLHFSSNVVVTASCDAGSYSGTPQIEFCDKNKNQIDYWGMATTYSTIDGRMARTFTLPKETYYVRFMTVEATNYMLEFGDKNSPYEPFGATYQVFFPSAAGTVYGGTLFINQDGTGTLVVDHKLGTVNGSEGYTWTLSNATTRQNIYRNFASNFSGIKTTGGKDTTCIFNEFKNIATDATQVNGAYIESGYVNMNFPLGTFADSAAVNTWLASNNLQAFYSLATPVSYTLTLSELITLLSGLNNVWSDTGDILSMLYACNNNAQKDGTYEDMTAGNALFLLSDRGETDNTPYIFRKTGGSANAYGREKLKKVVGGTVAWNQLANPSNGSGSGITLSVNNGEITVTGEASANVTFDLSSLSNNYYPAGHKFIICGIPSGGSVSTFRIVAGNSGRLTDTIFNQPTTDNSKKAYLQIYSGYSPNLKFKLIYADLTQMFGSTIADAIYAMEQATAGSGVAFFRSLFPKDYYAYDSGTLMSVQTSGHKVTGFNQFDEIWESGSFSNGQPIANADWSRSKNFIHVFPGIAYKFMIEGLGTTNNAYVMRYDIDKNFIDYPGVYTTEDIINMPSNCHYIMIQYKRTIETVVNYKVCINISDPAKNGTYEPYDGHLYPLSPIALRGIPKWNSGVMYYDGDEYYPDGKVVRKYGIVDLGTLPSWTYSTIGSDKRFYTNDLSSVIKPPSSISVLPNIICTSLPTKLPSQYNETVNGITIYTNGSIQVYDSAFASLSVDEFITAMSGVYLVYELATPTTEQADPFHEIQICNGGGTEEFLDNRDVAVPVGTESFYPVDIWALLDAITAQLNG